MVFTNTNFLPLQLYVNYKPKYDVLNTVSNEQFPINPATASLININNHSLSITYSLSGNQMQG